MATSSDGDLLSRERDHLIERALRVAHAAFGVARDQRDGVLVGVNALGLHDGAELAGDRRRADDAELVLLRARADRLRDLVQLRRRHDEDDVRRRLLHRLEQRVERLRRELVHLVDDEDLVAIADRRHRERADDHLADVVDAGVGGRVDLEDVDVAPLRDLHAGVALAARIRRRPLHAVQRPRQDARGGRLADPAGAGEDERLREAAARERVAKRRGDGLLADHVLEPLRTPLPGEDLVGHWNME